MHENKEQVKPQVILFDVYDTLLDVNEIKRRINTALDTRRAILSGLSC